VDPKIQTTSLVKLEYELNGGNVWRRSVFDAVPRLRTKEGVVVGHRISLAVSGPADENQLMMLKAKIERVNEVGWQLEQSIPFLFPY